ncbi:MAG: hypothetical protein WCL14_01435 [Bacteroidota bacterium]
MIFAPIVQLAARWGKSVAPWGETFARMVKGRLFAIWYTDFHLSRFCLMTVCSKYVPWSLALTCPRLSFCAKAFLGGKAKIADGWQVETIITGSCHRLQIENITIMAILIGIELG